MSNISVIVNDSNNITAVVDQGVIGPSGAAATVAVGTTTTLSPGASATVSNSGTSTAAVFNFGVPQGPVGATGPTGATGAQGIPGNAATIAAGTTTTGAPGTSAAVTNVGTSSAAVFDFAIPRGDVGATGPTGATGAQGIPGIPGINWLGAWSSATTYAIRDAVEYNGSSYYAIASNTNQAPPNLSFWNLLAEKGANGTGSGDVIGPASATDNAVVRFDGTTGELIQNSSVTIDDSGNLTYSAGTANGVAYLNGSKVLTTGSALVFDSSNRLSVNQSSSLFGAQFEVTGGAVGQAIGIHGRASDGIGNIVFGANGLSTEYARIQSDNTSSLQFGVGSSGSEQMRLTSTGLGIGTSSPAYKLDVRGSAGSIVSWSDGTTPGVLYSGSDYVGLTFPAATGGFFINPTGNFCTISTNGAERLRIDSSGNLGLGVTPSAWSTFGSIIQGQGYALAGFSSGSNVQSALFCNSFFNGSNYIYSSSAAASEYLQISGQHQWFTAPSGTAGNAISFTQAMTLDASGNLGVGVTSPASKLHVGVVGGGVIARFAHTGETNNPYAYFKTNEAGNLASLGSFSSGGNSALGFLTADTERARITSGGFFGLGTNNPVAMFDLAGDYKEGVVTANTGTAYTINTTTGTLQILTLTGNCTFTFPTATTGESFTLFLRQDGTGGRTVTWPANVRWPGGTAPTITSTASRQDKFIFTADGVNFYGSNAGQNYTV
jgi:hypothetical protein